MSSCKVFDRMHLIQCYTCQSFGHIKKSSFCPLKDQNKTICLYCSENHLSKNCSYKANKKYDKFKCSNCAQSSNPVFHSNAVGHTTTSNKCPIFQSEVKATINRTAGMDSKNDQLPYVSNIGHLRELKLGCFNVCSLRNKLIEVTALLHDHGVYIACISETWLIGEDKPVIMEINELGYQM